MEPEGSLPCSQEPTSGPCPEPDTSSMNARTVCMLVLYMVKGKAAPMRN
jgi:hypothetical protein